MFQKSRKLLSAALAAGAVLVGSTAHATTVNLNLVDSFARTSAFGLAFDGTNIWWSDDSGNIHEMTTAGVDTGNVITGTGWSALAWDATNNKIATVNGGGLQEYSRATAGATAGSALSPLFKPIAGSPNFLTDGLDIQGNTVYWSPDVSAVYSSPLDGSGVATQIAPLGGLNSGIEYVSAGGSDFLITVNDAANPRTLCVSQTSGAAIGCTTLSNSRYEDLGFDGRYLYAADYYGSRIDKIDLLVDGGSIFVPPPNGSNVPEPASIAILGAAMAWLGFCRRRS